MKERVPCRGLVVGLLLVACVAVAARSTPEAVPLIDASNHVSVTQPGLLQEDSAPKQGEETEDPSLAKQANSCSGVPSTSQIYNWKCPRGVKGGETCSGECAPGISAPYGAPAAVCSGGQYTIIRKCMTGKQLLKKIPGKQTADGVCMHACMARAGVAGRKRGVTYVPVMCVLRTEHLQLAHSTITGPAI